MTRMSTTARTGMVLAGSAALCLSMTACGGKSGSKTTAGASKAAAAATSSASASTGTGNASPTSSSMKHTTTSTASASTSGTASCTKAKIGGVNKCIQAGQMCSLKHAADYKAYGFACETKGNEYILSKV